MPVSTFRFSGLLAGTALFALGVCQAVDAPRGLGDGNGSGPLLTRDQLRDCFAQQSQIAAGNVDAKKARALLDAEQARLDESGKRLGAQAAEVDLKNVDAVAAYNAKVLARQQEADAYATRANQVQAQGAALQAQQGEFIKNCDNRRYDARDAAAVGIGK